MHRLVIVGRPNDGKSSIFANFLGDDEVAVSPIPGETKRMQPRQINLGDKNIEIIDNKINLSYIKNSAHKVNDSTPNNVVNKFIPFDA